MLNQCLWEEQTHAWKCGNSAPSIINCQPLLRPPFTSGIVLGTGYKHKQVLSWPPGGPQASEGQARPLVQKLQRVSSWQPVWRPSGHQPMCNLTRCITMKAALCVGLSTHANLWKDSAEIIHAVWRGPDNVTSVLKNSLLVPCVTQSNSQGPDPRRPAHPLPTSWPSCTLLLALSTHPLCLFVPFLSGKPCPDLPQGLCTCYSPQSLLANSLCEVTS